MIMLAPPCSVVTPVWEETGLRAPSPSKVLPSTQGRLQGHSYVPQGLASNTPGGVEVGGAGGGGVLQMFQTLGL